jgi:hypothetical protein
MHFFEKGKKCRNLRYKSTLTDIYLADIQGTKYKAVLRIHDILGWIRIRIRGSMPLTNGSGSGFGSGFGSGSGSCYFRQ